MDCGKAPRSPFTPRTFQRVAHPTTAIQIVFHAQIGHALVLVPVVVAGIVLVCQMLPDGLVAGVHKGVNLAIRLGHIHSAGFVRDLLDFQLWRVARIAGVAIPEIVDMGSAWFIASLDHENPIVEVDLYLYFYSPIPWHQTFRENARPPGISVASLSALARALSAAWSGTQYSLGMRFGLSIWKAHIVRVGAPAF